MRGKFGIRIQAKILRDGRPVDRVRTWCLLYLLATANKADAIQPESQLTEDENLG
jgi:hypothetical protein